MMPLNAIVCVFAVSTILFVTQTRLFRRSVTIHPLLNLISQTNLTTPHQLLRVPQQTATFRFRRIGVDLFLR
jgi:hypothetical protein